jgi:hypothetical protein
MLLFYHFDKGDTMFSWTILYRLLAGVLTLVGIAAGIVVATQGTGLDATALAWWGVVAAFCPLAVAVLPSLFGLSSTAPKQESTVIAEAENRGVVRMAQAVKDDEAYRASREKEGA